MIRTQSFKHENAFIKTATDVAFDLSGVAVMSIEQGEKEGQGNVTLLFDSTATKEAYVHAYARKLQGMLVPVNLVHIPAHPGLPIPPRYTHSPCNRAWAKSAAAAAHLEVIEEGPESVTLNIDNKIKFRVYMSKYLQLTHTTEKVLQ